MKEKWQKNKGCIPEDTPKIHFILRIVISFLLNCFLKLSIMWSTMSNLAMSIRIVVSCLSISLLHFQHLAYIQTRKSSTHICRFTVAPQSHLKVTPFGCSCTHSLMFMEITPWGNYTMHTSFRQTTNSCTDQQTPHPVLPNLSSVDGSFFIYFLLQYLR